MASNRRLSVPENVGGPLRGRLLKRSWPVRLVLVAALLLAVPFLFDAGATVHAADNDVTGLTLTSLNPGELAITWDAPSRAPTDYRVTWKKSTASWPSYRNENTVDGGNAFPTGTSHTVSDLEEGTEYSVRVRARYYDANDNLTESGPWSDPPVEVTVSSQLPSAENRSDKEQVPPRKSKKSPPLHDNLSYSLNELIRQNHSQGTSSGNRLPRDGGAVEESATVVVYVEVAHVQDVVLFLRNNGATVRSPDPGDDYLVAEVPLSLLPRLSQRPDVKFVKVDELVQQSGGPGATAHGAAPWDTAGYDGTGIKVGVIDTGFHGYTALIGTHLPQPEAVRCWTSKMDVRHDNLADCEAASESNHGTAVTEMLFDVAPGATYYLARILNTSHTEDAVDWLIEQGVDVINMSVSFPWDGPGDGTSPYTDTALAIVDTAVHGGAFIAATAGNQGGESWYGELADSDGDNVLEFKEGDECNLVTLEADKDYRFDLRWNDTWYTASVDLDTRLTGPDGVSDVVGRSERSQDGRDFRDPFERISYTPTVAGDYCFVVEIESGHTIPTWAQFMVDSSLHVTIEHTTAGHSIGSPGETKNEGALTVGAAAHDDTTTIATYSSRGPLPDGTIKPDIVGADKVHSQVYDSDAGGTSFSAPHVAGLAAVVKERFPDYSPSKIATYLKDNALARGAPTPNNTWGHGFAHLPANPPSQPVVTGRAEVGEALTVNISAITDGDGVTTATADSSFSVQWVLVNSDNVHKDIDKADSSTYTISSGDIMHRIRARVSFTDDASNDEVTYSEATNVVNSDPTGILDIDGTARIGRTLTAHVVKVEDPDGVVEPFAFQWVRVDSDDAETVIPTATSSTYRLIDADAGHRIKYKLSFTDGIDNTETLDSELTTTVGPSLLVGNTGQTTSSTSYVSILPATASTPTKIAQSFTTGSEDNYLITSLNAFVSTGTPTAEIWDDSSGTPGKMIAALTNPDSIPSGTVPDQLIEFSAADVSLVRETTYWVLFTLDSGQIRVRTTTLTDEDDGSEEKWAIGNDFSAFIHEGTAWETGMSDQMESGPVMIQVIGVVLNSNDEPMGDLLLSGAPQVGEALTVDVSSVGDRNGLADATFEYQWVSIDGATETDIGSATGTSYTLTAGDEGKRIKVKVTYTDDAGYDESLVSVTTQPVRPQDGIGIMVSNLYQESDGTTYADRDYPHLMQAFDTGDNADGYTLNGVRVGAIAWDDGVNPLVSITEDIVYQGESAPGPVLYTIETTTAISTDENNPSVDVDFAAGDVYLAPNTRYWVQFFFPGRGAGDLYVGVTREDDDDFGAAPGWTIADFHVYTNPGQVISELEYDDNNQLRIAVLGKAGAGNRLPEGQPAISGEAQVNKVLTADTSGITDGDGLTMATYTYQWVRVDGATDTDITDATSQTYTLAEDDLGKRFRVEVSFSDDRNHSAELSSRATQPVRPESGDGIQVSNAGQDTADLVGVDKAFPLNAVSFTTGGHSGGYNLTSIRVAGIVNEEDATPEVFLYGDASGVPGMELHTLKVPSDIPTGATENPAPAELTPDSAVLTPHTTYWVVFKKTDSTEAFYLRFTDSTDDDDGAASGWSLGDELAYQPEGETNWQKGGFADHLFLLQITVKADLITVPDAPASLTATAGDAQVTLEWTAPASDGGSAVTGYEYRYKTTGEFPDEWTNVPDGPDDGTDRSDERSYTVTGLDNGVEHTFEVRAVNTVGGGDATEATSTPVTVPGPPASLNATAGDTEVTLDWTVPASNGGSAVTGYEYRVSVDGGSTWSPDWTDVPDGSDSGTDRSDERSYTVTGLDNGVLHTFEVRAVNVVGEGAPASATSTPVTVPGAPASLNATAGDTQVTLDWTVPASNGGSAVTGYQYRVSDDDGSTWSPDWTNVPDGSDAGTDRSDERSYTVTALDNGVEHTFEVRAVNAVGAGGVAEATSTPATPVTVPGAPASLMATAGDTEVGLVWTAPASDGGSVVTEYEYRYKTTGEFPDEWTDVPDGSDTGTDRSDERSYTVTGLDNGVLHTFEVRAVNVVGEGAPATATSTPVTVPGAPASLNATAGDTQVTLAWTEPGSDGGSAVTGYEYRYKTSGEFPDEWTDVPDGSDDGTDRSDERSYTVTGLDNGVEHTFEVRAVNAVGAGGVAEATSTPATPVTVPEAPASLMATAGDTEVTLSWTVPGSDGGSAVTEYQYRVSVDGGSTWSPDWTDVPDGSDSGTDRSDERSYTVTGLDNGVLHTFEVRAVNVVGEGAPASATSTPVTVPEAPASLNATAGDTQVNLDWTAPASDGGSAVTEYQYRVSDDAGSTWSPDWTDVPDGSDTGADRSDERSYTVTGLDNSVEHTFEVRAVNAVGAGGVAEATSTPATPVTVPGAPASLMATAGDTQMTLAWTVPGSDGGSAVTGYQYRYKTSGEFPDEWTDVPDGSDTGTDRSDERSYTVTGLDNGVLHTFEVRAVNVVGEGAPASATSTPMTTPTLPLSLDVIAGDDVVNIAEKAGGFAITGDTGSVGGASVTVTIGSGTLTATSAPSGAWTVTVPVDASYVTGASVDVTVNATLTGYNAAVELTSTLAVDLVRPSVQTAEVSGTSLELGYSEGLDGSSTPAADAFTVVKTDSTSATSTVGLASVDPVQVSGSVVTLTLDTAVPPGDTVTVDYTVPTGMDAMPLRDTAGNAVEALVAHAVPNVPGAPASVEATAGDTQVTLAWTVPGSDGGSAVTEYQYRVSDDAGSTWSPDWTGVPDGSDTGTDRSDERSYTVTGLDNGVEHTFEVRAVNAVGAGGVAEATSTPATPVTVPEAPASLNATAGDTQVTLEWTAPASDGGSAVTGYEYRYKTTGEFPDEWTDVPDGSDTGTDRGDERSYTVTGLDNGVEHTFQLRAVNAVGAGGVAEATSTPATPVTVPGAPASLMATAGDTEVGLVWTAPASDGGSAVTEYQYRYKTSGEFPDEWTDVPDGSDTGTDRSDERSYTVTGLDNGVLHTFEVRAVNVAGEGAPATATSTPVTVPEAPASLNATAGDTEVTLSWTAPASDGGSAVTEYQYRVSDDAGSTWSPDWTGVPDGSDSGSDRSDETSYTVTGLDNGVEHTFEVRAVNVVGEGAPATATSTPMTTPTLPLSLDVIAGDDVVNIAEKAGGFAITGDTGNVSGASVTVTIGSGTLTATSASSGAWTVTVPVAASYVTGASVDVTVNATLTGYNAAVELTSTLAVDLVRPSVQTAEVSGTSLELGYSEGLDGSSTPPADAFTVVKTDSTSATSTVGLASVDPVQVSGSVVTLTLSSAVPPGDTVTVDYTAPTGVGAMPVRDTAGNAVEALVAHAVPNVPGAPASLNGAPGDTQVTLTWTAPGSDGGSAVTEYQYRVSDDAGSTWSPDWTDVPDGSDSGTDRSDERSYTVTGLDNGVLHTFEVRAVNVVGEGAPATATSTPVTVPGAPASLMATAGDTEVTLDWTAPATDGGSSVTGYEYRVSADGGSTWSPDWTGVPDGSDAGSDLHDETSYTVTGLDNGVLHTFEVRAVNVVGEGAPATATSTPMTTPTLPLSLDTIAGDDVVNIAEKAGGFAITGDTGSVGGASVTVTIGSGTLTATSAPSGAWTVTVPSNASYVTGASVDITVNATLTGYNAAVELTSTLAVDLVRPSVQTAEVSGTSLELGYSEGLDGSSTPAADAFTVVKTDSTSATSTVGLASVDPVQVSGSVVTLTLSSAVPPGDTVTVDYTAPTGVGAMPVRDTAGNAVEALVAHAVPNVPGAPASVEATAGDTQVTLAWTEPASDGGSDITEYQYRVSDDAGSTWSPDWTDVPDGSDTGTDRSDETSFTVTGLDNGVEHTFEVRAVNAVGAGGVAEATSTPATPVTVPGAPASLMATAGDTRVSLDWTEPASDGGSAVTEYQYRYKTSGEFPDEWTDVPDGSDTGTDRSDERSFTVTGLDNGVLHTFEVRAVNAVGAGSHREIITTPLTGTRNLWPQFDETSTREDVQVMIPVLTNDASPNRDSLKVISVTQPMNGTASLNSAISLVKYTPNDGFTGMDSFTYTVSDGLETATAAVLIAVEASEIDGDENQEWIATATTTLVTEGEVVAIDLATTSQDAIVSEEQTLFATLQIGRLEGTVDEGDFQVEDSDGEILQSHTITPTIHHNGGWIHGLRWFPGKSVGSFRIRAAENEDSGSGNEYLVYWVYVEGLLVGSGVITIEPGT